MISRRACCVRANGGNVFMKQTNTPVVAKLSAHLSTSGNVVLWSIPTNQRTLDNSQHIIDIHVYRIYVCSSFYLYIAL